MIHIFLFFFLWRIVFVHILTGLNLEQMSHVYSLIRAYNWRWEQGIVHLFNRLGKFVPRGIQILDRFLYQSTEFIKIRTRPTDEGIPRPTDEGIPSDTSWCRPLAWARSSWPSDQLRAVPEQPAKVEAGKTATSAGRDRLERSILPFPRLPLAPQPHLDRPLLAVVHTATPRPRRAVPLRVAFGACPVEPARLRRGCGWLGSAHRRVRGGVGQTRDLLRSLRPLQILGPPWLAQVLLHANLWESLEMFSFSYLFISIGCIC
jgi:hypothetical protein